MFGESRPAVGGMLDVVKESEGVWMLLDGVTDGFHVGEDNVPVAALQPLHELQVVADLEASDWLLLHVNRECLLINTVAN